MLKLIGCVNQFQNYIYAAVYQSLAAAKGLGTWFLQTLWNVEFM